MSSDGSRSVTGSHQVKPKERGGGRHVESRASALGRMDGEDTVEPRAEVGEDLRSSYLVEDLVVHPLIHPQALLPTGGLVCGLTDGRVGDGVVSGDQP